MIDSEKVIENLEKAKTIIEQWIPMFEQYNTPAEIDDAIALLKEQKTMEEEQEYIISYAKDYFRVDPVYWFPERKADYLYAVSRHHLKEGDIAPWNNQYWWSVKAKNAKSAFEKFLEKFASEITPSEKEK